MLPCQAEILAHAHVTIKLNKYSCASDSFGCILWRMAKTFTTEEAAAELGISAGRVRQLIVDGTLEAGKFGRDRVITKEALDKAKRRKTTPGPEPKSQKKGGAKG
jgi:excisionase family DNA binding protein